MRGGNQKQKDGNKENLQNGFCHGNRQIYPSTMRGHVTSYAFPHCMVCYRIDILDGGKSLLTSDTDRKLGKSQNR